MVAVVIKTDGFPFHWLDHDYKSRFLFYATKVTLAGLYNTQYMIARWLDYLVQSVLILEEDHGNDSDNSCEDRRRSDRGI